MSAEGIIQLFFFFTSCSVCCFYAAWHSLQHPATGVDDSRQTTIPPLQQDDRDSTQRFLIRLATEAERTPSIAHASVLHTQAKAVNNFTADKNQPHLTSPEITELQREKESNR